MCHPPPPSEHYFLARAASAAPIPEVWEPDPYYRWHLHSDVVAGKAVSGVNS